MSDESTDDRSGASTTLRLVLDVIGFVAYVVISVILFAIHAILTVASL